MYVQLSKRTHALDRERKKRFRKLDAKQGQTVHRSKGMEKKGKTHRKTTIRKKMDQKKKHFFNS